MTGTELDALKDTFWEVRTRLDYVVDYLGGNSILDDEHHVYDFLSNLTQFTAARLGEFVPGITWEGRVIMNDSAWVASRTYDDGTWAIQTVTLDSGAQADYRPRFDGDFEKWMQLFDELPLASEAD